MKPTKEQYQELINKGLTSKQIAQQLGIGTSTAKGHIRDYGLKTIFKKERIPIDKEKLENLIALNYSTYKIATALKCSQTNVRHWINKFGLKTITTTKYGNKTKKYLIGDEKICPKCNRNLLVCKENFYIKKSGIVHAWCKQCNNQITYQKQKQMKIDAVKYKGGKCKICGYDKYVGALDFHHINPDEKDFGISELRSYTWDTIKKELDKCICVCRNCHAEIHAGLIN